MKKIPDSEKYTLLFPGTMPVYAYGYAEITPYGIYAEGYSEGNCGMIRTASDAAAGKIVPRRVPKSPMVLLCETGDAAADRITASSYRACVFRDGVLTFFRCGHPAAVFSGGSLSEAADFAAHQDSLYLSLAYTGGKYLPEETFCRDIYRRTADGVPVSCSPCSFPQPVLVRDPGRGGSYIFSGSDSDGALRFSVSGTAECGYTVTADAGFAYGRFPDDRTVYGTAEEAGAALRDGVSLYRKAFCALLREAMYAADIYDSVRFMCASGRREDACAAVMRAADAAGVRRQESPVWNPDVFSVQQFCSYLTSALF